MVFLLVRLPIGPDSCSQSRYLHWLNIEQQITSLWCFCWTWEAIITALSPFPFWHPPVTQTHTYLLYTHRPKIHTCNGIIRIIRPFTWPSDMDAHGETWLKWQRGPLQTALTCVQAHNQTDWRWLYFLSDHLGGDFSVALLSSYGGNEWMTQVEDEQTPGLTRWWSPHNNTKRWKRGRTNVCRKRKRWRGGRGVFPGFQSDATPAPHVVSYRLKPTVHFSQQHSRERLGVGGYVFPLCCYGNTGFVVFSLPLTWADVCKHILAKCVVQPSEAIAPFQLVEGSLRSEQPADNKALAHTWWKTEEHADTSPASQKSSGVFNCTFGLEDGLL